MDEFIELAQLFLETEHRARYAQAYADYKIFNQRYNELLALTMGQPHFGDGLCGMWVLRERMPFNIVESLRSIPADEWKPRPLLYVAVYDSANFGRLWVSINGGATPVVREMLIWQEQSEGEFLVVTQYSFEISRKKKTDRTFKVVRGIEIPLTEFISQLAVEEVTTPIFADSGEEKFLKKLLWL